VRHIRQALKFAVSIGRIVSSVPESEGPAGWSSTRSRRSAVS
jgi:hypothetical protein